MKLLQELQQMRTKVLEALTTWRIEYDLDNGQERKMTVRAEDHPKAYAAAEEYFKKNNIKIAAITQVVKA